MMENRGWKEVKLEELIKFGNGKQRPDAEGLIPVYGGNGILSYTNSSNYDGETLIIGRVGAYCGAVYYDNRPIWISDNALSGKPKDNYDTKFLYYFLKNLDLNQFAGGSSHPLVTQTLLNSLEFKVCINHNEQKAIASVLSSLDDKIDLLHQQNQTLEALAETLFRQWFVEEAKEDWDVLPLSEIAEVKNGKSFKSSDFTDNDFNSFEVVKMGHIERGGGLKLNPKKDYVSREMDVEKWVLNKGDIIMAMTDMKDNVVILGVPAMIDKDDHYVLNQRVARIYLKDNSKLISNYLLYIQLNNKEFIAELQTKANSGVQVNLSTGAIKESEILIPPISLQKEFGQKIIDFYSKIENNREQIQTLTKLRDTLLPKLMSGEVRVKM